MDRFAVSVKVGSGVGRWKIILTRAMEAGEFR